MADVNSTLFAGLSGKPNTRFQTTHKGIVKSAAASLEVAGTESAADLLSFIVVPSSAAPRSLRLVADASITTTGAADFGVYTYDGEGVVGAAVDADLFASAQALFGGIDTDILTESGVIDIADLGRPLWELAGLTEDPNELWVIVGTVTASPGAAGSVVIDFRYVDTN